MDPISMAIMAAAGLAKTIVGGVQMVKGRKDLNKQLANMPKYSRPDEYNKLLSIYQQQAGMAQLPGQDRYEAALSTRTARGVRAAQKYADSPVAAVAATMGLYGQEQQAIRDLGLQFADYKMQAQHNLAGAYGIGMQQAEKEFGYNQWYPAQVRLNMAAQRMNAGNQNLWGGLDTMGGAALGFASEYVGANQGKLGVATSPQNTAAMTNIANAAQLPSASLNNWVGQGTAQDFQMFNNSGMYVPRFGEAGYQAQPAMTPYNIYGTNNLLYKPYP